MQQEIIQTKIRPIKKLFILRDYAISDFIEIVKRISCEVSGVRNIFLLADRSLFSRNQRAFVERQDPDVIINFSDIEDHTIHSHFHRLVINRSDHTLGHFGTRLEGFTNVPPLFRNILDPMRESEAYANHIEGKDAEALHRIVNLGLLEEGMSEHLVHTIFQKMVLRQVHTAADLCHVWKEPSGNFLCLCEEIGVGSYAPSSRADRNYNENPNFLEGQTAVVGAHDHLWSIVAFWNARAAYPLAKMIWIPRDLLQTYASHLDEVENFVVFGKLSYEVLKEFKPTFNEIPHNMLFISGTRDDWLCFDHIQATTVSERGFHVQHPRDKMFSSFGVGGPLAIEIRGLREFNFPQDAGLGQLFTGKLPDIFSKSDFSRISSKGLSLSYVDFEILDSTGISMHFRLPTLEECFVKYFEDRGLHIRRNEKSILLDRLVDLVGGLDRLSVICDRQVIDLFVLLTPRRVARIVKDTVAQLRHLVEEEEIHSALSQIVRPENVLVSNTIVDVRQIPGMVGAHRSPAREAFMEKLEHLYRNNLLLRGKSFKCTSCNSSLWFSFDQISRVNFCYCCGHEISIPIFQNGQFLDDYLRLNELVVSCVDQGQLPTAVTVHYFLRQRFEFSYLCNLDILENGTAPTTDIDAIIKLGRRIGISEIKANRGFDENQVRELIRIGRVVNAQFLVFATLLTANSPEVADLEEWLNGYDLRIPAFVLTEEALFAPASFQIHKHFEIDRNSGLLPTGPIVVGRTKQLPA